MGNLTTGSQPESQSWWQKATSMVFGRSQESQDSNLDVHAVEGKSYLSPDKGKHDRKLADRDITVPGLDQALMTVQEHGVIRTAKDHDTLDALQNRYNNDEELDDDNRQALMAAVQNRREELGSTDTRH
ncbi:hypothetical protein [Parendozoicomonas sp. Alg238-R29]|uniref:hypothetical protein n=1 Tax=Parendozoicomonas sp. Alg238-R29 TaxID=2993446 RepID=UPI00248EAC12|nr:hypothetical protein [Parendozoicomonas sp. Alg238-R29]